MKFSLSANKHLVVVAVGLLLSSGAWADTSKIRWDKNGHDYQYIDSVGLNWGEAKRSCINKGGYLATITSQEEQDFINTNVSYYGGYIGARKIDKDAVWGWIDGEKFKYTNWSSGQPGDGQGVAWHGNGVWYAVTGSDASSYLCEFDPQAFSGITVLPDMDGNGAPEQAALYVTTTDQKINIDIRDSATGLKLNVIRFANPSTTPPVAIAPIADATGDGKPHVAVLFSGLPSSKPFVRIYDASSGALLKTISFFNNKIVPVSLTQLPDVNANGVSELVVLGIDPATGKGATETRDAATGEILYAVKY